MPSCASVRSNALGWKKRLQFHPVSSRCRVGITLPCACADTLGKFTLLERAAKIIRTKYAYDQEAIKSKEAGAPVDYVFPLTYTPKENEKWIRNDPGRGRADRHVNLSRGHSHGKAR